MSGHEAGPGDADARRVAALFAVGGDLLSLASHEVGHINASWIARFGSPEGERRFLLQRVNRTVFREPQAVMDNMVRVTRHVAGHLEREGAADRERRVLRLVRTRGGATHHTDPDGEVWRLMPFIEGTRTLEGAATGEEAEAAARAFGLFLRQLADLPGPPLHETIPRFHDTPSRFAALEGAASRDAVSRAASTRAEIDALGSRAGLAGALAALADREPALVGAVHNDAKVANVLFDLATNEPLCVVDLDTVMPGLALHDFGDLVRSTVSDSAEDERDLSRVRVRVEVFAALARGFLEGARERLSSIEREHLVTAARVIVFEQAARFLTDHLEGDPYYRVRRPGHNLDRARAQLRLLESLEEHEAELEGAVDAL